MNSNLCAVIDDADAHLILPHRWFIDLRKVRALARVGDQLLAMHRLILPQPPGMWVDHIDRNALNNCRDNLRPCTRAQNNANRRMSDANKLRVRGVCDIGGGVKRYRARVGKGGRRFESWHASIEEASAWVRMKSIELHGEFACLDGCLPL